MESRSQDPTAPGTTADAAPSGARADDHGNGHGVTDDQTPGASFRAAQQTVAQILEYVSFYISAKLDALKLSARNVAIYAVLGILGMLAGIALIVMAVVMLCMGIAQSISALFRTGPWLGNLATAILLLGGLVIGVMVGMRKLSGTSRERTVKKYAARKQQQRAKFGEDVGTKRGPIL